MRYAIAAGLIVIAVVVALFIQRRQRAPAPTQSTYTVPTQLDRADFVRPEAAWLVVLFSSATCLSCAAVWEEVQVLEDDGLAVQDVEVAARRDLHRRYAIDAVPTILVADHEGVVQASFVGPPTGSALSDKVAELRQA